MANAGRVVGRALMVAIPAVLGVAAIFYAGKLRTPPEPAVTQRQPSPVRVITVEPIDLVPRVSGYGSVAPVREWRAVARIEGEVAEIAEFLAPGDIVEKGTLLFRIDDSDLKLDLASVDAQLSASEVKGDTIRSSLELAKSDLELAQSDLKRQEQLNSQGVVTQAALETARRQELTARIKVTDLENQFVLNGAEREVLVTQRVSLQRSIGFAEIRAPYELRVNELSSDLGQYVSRGQVLMAGEGTEAVDISAQFAIGRVGPLLRLTGNDVQVTDLTAKVKLPAPGHTVAWDARVERMGDAIDERTQSAPVVVRVDDPQEQSVIGERPPLRRNMLVEVELSAPGRKALVVPAEAVQNGTALVVSAEGTLEKRSVETAFTSGDLTVVTKGLAAGDQLVVTDPSIVVPGMAVKPVEDTARKAEIAAQAAGRPTDAAKPGAGAGKNKEAEQ